MDREEIQKNKEHFIEICQSTIKREGIDRLLTWLQNTDFFSAPASTKYHDSVEGGLCYHSLKVYNFLKRMGLTNYSDESVAIVALFHDLCKVNFYKTDYKNQKDENGVWQKVPYYTVDDKLAMGHGEASVFILQTFIKLTKDESLAIRWHMGGFDESVRGGSIAISKAYEQSPLPVELHIADLRATYLNIDLQ